VAKAKFERTQGRTSTSAPSVTSTMARTTLTSGYYQGPSRRTPRAEPLHAVSIRSTRRRRRRPAGIHDFRSRHVEYQDPTTGTTAHVELSRPRGTTSRNMITGCRRQMDGAILVVLRG